MCTGRGLVASVARARLPIQRGLFPGACWVRAGTCVRAVSVCRVRRCGVDARREPGYHHGCGESVPGDADGRRVEGQPWAPIFGGQPWVPAQKSSTVGPRDQFSLLRALGNQTKLSTFDTVAFRVRRRPDRFHALRRAPPLHSPCQKFGNTDYFLKFPAKAKMRCSMP